MYSIPGNKETQGSTERFIGSWLKDQRREDLVVGTKVTGPYEYFNYIRENLGFSNAVIYDGVELFDTLVRGDFN